MDSRVESPDNTDPAVVPVISVCAAVIMRDNSFLLATRRQDSHLAGKWEFPGGKTHGDEGLCNCIRRELHEELGLRVLEAEHIRTLVHDYDGKRIILHFMHCTISPDAKPICNEGQKCAWVPLEEMNCFDLAAADKRFVEILHGGQTR